ncbi:MAG: putative molybdenum carrier protein [Alphaproteobacteria bacterium]
MHRNLLQRVRRIVSGGQTGVDRAALDFAIENSIPYGGWCPKGGWAEDFPHPPGLAAKYPRLRETPGADPRQRTEWNVRDSALTLMLLAADDLRRFPGTLATYQAAQTFERPCRIVTMGAGAIDAAGQWLAENLGEGILNVAGPRESESPGIYLQAMVFLGSVFEL